MMISRSQRFSAIEVPPSNSKIESESPYSALLKQKQTPKFFFFVAGNEYDLVSLKKSFFEKKHLSQISSGLKSLLSESKLNEFLINGIRCFVVHFILDFSTHPKKYPHLPSVLYKLVRDLSRAGLFGQKLPSLAESLEEKIAAFQDFGKSYCFLELLVARQNNRASGERSCMELFYAMVKELSKDLINLPVLNSVLETDLDKAFRSEIFSKKQDIDAKEVSKVILEDRRSIHQNKTDTPKRRQSIKYGIIPSENDDWKSAVPDTTLQWLQGKIFASTGAALRCDSNEDSDNIHLEQK